MQMGEFYSSFNSFFAELDSVAKRHYLQTDEPSQFAKSAETERIYAQVGTLETRQLPNNQMFFQNQLDTMGKIPRKFEIEIPNFDYHFQHHLTFFLENPDDIYPYATFILPEADCGAGNGTKVQITAYQQTPDSIRQQIMLTQQDTLMSSQPQISTLVFQEQSTLPLSDACSKSVSCQFDEIFILQLDVPKISNALFYHILE